ncbi:hypothetical protein HO133_003659 [Letharia lupina]|uniref:Uncharacterized protein n=1 Tax=Letharia lupina TaxID=560253 RepID=A0A8H6CAS3_9LECA|nr:uncharacterized protein HO133_003659 [Letharia lupina]KAF6219834.1 hypothetical protein HO133_003659 [Letharia lupina]
MRIPALLVGRHIDHQNAIHHLGQTIFVAIGLRLEEGALHLRMETHILQQQIDDVREAQHIGVGMEAATEEDRGPQRGHIRLEEIHAPDHPFPEHVATPDLPPRSPSQRERIPSPTRERYERRDFSPLRNARPRFPNESNYRHPERSASPVRRTEHASRIASPISSRRSSPYVHTDRLANTGSGPHSPAFRGSRVPPAARYSGYRDKSPPRRGYSPVPVSPPREAVPYRARSPPPRERDDYRNGDTPATWSGTQMATPQSSGYRNGDSRPPPSGPGGYRDSYARESPSGPPPSAPISMSAHNRPASASVLSAPTRPRGGPSFAGRDSRGQPYSGPQPHRGGRPPPQSTYHAPSRQQYESRPPPSEHIPHGPRAHHGPSAPFESSYRAPPPFRSNNSSSTTYPRTQRFNTNHLASVPAIVPGGEALPSALDPAARKRLAELEEQKKKLQDQIDEKQREKRRGLREWDSKERESRRDGLRSELAEEALEAMSGEGAGTGTAF